MGAAINPANPFERLHVEEDPAAVEELRRIDPEWEPPAPKTAFFIDDTQTLITINHRVTRDVDVLAELARWQCGAVLISITTLDRDLAAAMEPRASGPAMRLGAIRTLADAGIPVGVSVAPIIPGLHDNEIAPILEAARDEGAQFAAYSIVRLQGTVADVFTEWLERNVSVAKKETILARIRESHGGRLSDSRPGLRMTGEGERADQIGQLFRALSRRFGFEGVRPHVVTTQFHRREPDQLELGI